MSSPYGDLPTLAASTIKPFTVRLPAADLEELRTLLKSSRIGPPTYESGLQDRKYGITHDWLVDAKDQWLNNFDWAQHENHINSFPQFTDTVKDRNGNPMTIHFTGLFSQNPAAVPVMMLHGWPGSFLEFLPILEILKKKYTPQKLPYHIIVPSLPGYAFSSPPPIDTDFRLEDVALVLNRLMSSLGFAGGYVVQGGDVGSKVARVIGAVYDNCKAVHINFCLMPKPSGISDADLTETDIGCLSRAAEFSRTGSAYALEHATRPSTIGFVLNSNPLALLAWIGEKFLDWSDESPPLDTILADATLYWLTQSMPTSLYPYRQLFTPGNIGAHENPVWYIHKPFGFSSFPLEITPIPKRWAETTGNLVFYRQHRKGGHFAAMEEPEVLLQDIEEFIRQVWV